MSLVKPLVRARPERRSRAKLSTVRALGLDGPVFGGASDRIVAVWRARAARMYPSDFEDCREPVRYTLLAALRG